MNRKDKYKALVAYLLTFGLTPACMSTNMPTVRPIAHGQVGTEGVRIILEDETVLESGGAWSSPFQSAMVVAHSLKSQDVCGGAITPLAQANSECRAASAVAEVSCSKDFASTGKAADALRQLGARRVRVEHPAADEPLYGVLALCAAPEGATGPAARSYLIRIPASRVSETSGGRVSLVYEAFSGQDSEYTAHYSWMLWLSSVPL